MSSAWFEIIRAPEEKFFWRLKDGEGNILVSSKAFGNKKDCLISIQSTIEAAKGAKVVDLAPTWE